MATATITATAREPHFSLGLTPHQIETLLKAESRRSEFRSEVLRSFGFPIAAVR